MKKIFLILIILTSFINLHAQNLPITGENLDQNQNIDKILIDFMVKWKIPGGQLSIIKDGQFIYNKAIGFADKDSSFPIHTDNLMRIASCSKIITGMGIMKLVQDKKLKLTDKVFDILKDYLPTDIQYDSRLNDITVQMLLEHSGGWDASVSGDKVFLNVWKAADFFNIPRPANTEFTIKYILRDRLDFDPGTKYAYSNTGYSLLGELITKVSGEPYEKFIKEQILAPLAIYDMRLGKSLFKDRFEDEVIYYDYEDSYSELWSFDPSYNKPVNAVYGGVNNIDVSYSSGGWLSNAKDLATIIASLNFEPNFKYVLDKETVDLMKSPPISGATFPSGEYYAKGIVINPSSMAFDHQGALIGTSSIARYNGNVKGKNGIIWAAVFNFLPIRNLAEYVTDQKNSLSDKLNEVLNK